MSKDKPIMIEYKKKYELEDGSFIYSKKEHISIDNPNIPQRELLLRELDILIQPIGVDDDMDVKQWKKILELKMES